MNMRHLFQISLVFIILHTAQGQSAWYDQYLLSAFGDTEYQGQTQQIELLDLNKYRSPIVQEIDLRLRASYLNQTIEDYRLRLDIINPKLRQAEAQYQTAYLNYQRSRQHSTINTLLKTRYLDLLSYWYLDRLLSLTIQYQELIVKATSQMSNLDLIDAIEYNKIQGVPISHSELLDFVRQQLGS